MQEVVIYNAFQSTYHHKHSIVQELLYYTLQVLQGFKYGMFTISCFVDFEGAFSSVWQARIVYTSYARLAYMAGCYS